MLQGNQVNPLVQYPNLESAGWANAFEVPDRRNLQ